MSDNFTKWKVVLEIDGKEEEHQVLALNKMDAEWNAVRKLLERVKIVYSTELE